jgi:hypothetical protein
MKKFITTALTATLLLVFIPSCKKPVEPKTPQEAIIGKWLVENRLANEYYAGADHIINYPGNGTDHVDFRIDGKVYSDIGALKDTMSYSVSSAAIINIDGINFDIKTFNDKLFVIYNKEQLGGGDYDEMTISLKR